MEPFLQRCLSLCAKIWFALHFFLWNFFAVSLVFWMSTSTTTKSESTLSIIKVLPTTFTFYFLLYRHKRIVSLRYAARRLLLQISRKSQRAFERRCAIYLLTGTLLSFLFAYAKGYLCSRGIYDDLVDIFFFKCYSLVKGEGRKGILFLAGFLLRESANMTWVLVTYMYYALCLAMKMAVTDFQQKMIEMKDNHSPNLWRQDVIALQTQYDGIRKALDAANALAAGLVFLWYANALVLICSSLLSAIARLEIDVATSVDVLQLLIYVLVVVIWVSLTATAIPERSHNCLRLLSDLHLGKRNDSDVAYYSRLMGLIHSLRDYPFQLEAGVYREVIVDRSFLMSFFGVLLSFLVVNVQIYGYRLSDVLF